MNISTKIGNNPELDKFLQELCFKHGVVWNDDSAKFNNSGWDCYGNNYYLLLYDNNRLMYDGGHKHYANVTQVSTLEFIEAVKKKREVSVKLNSEYSAIVTKENVKVGCQTFTHEVILEVAEAIKKLTKE